MRTPSIAGRWRERRRRSSDQLRCRAKRSAYSAGEGCGGRPEVIRSMHMMSHRMKLTAAMCWKNTKQMPLVLGVLCQGGMVVAPLVLLLVALPLTDWEVDGRRDVLHRTLVIWRWGCYCRLFCARWRWRLGLGCTGSVQSLVTRPRPACALSLIGSRLTRSRNCACSAQCRRHFRCDIRLSFSSSVRSSVHGRPHSARLTGHQFAQNAERLPKQPL